MQRRQFLSVATAATAGSILSTNRAGAQDSDREYYELLQYRMRPGSHKSLLNNFVKTVAIPAWNRAGINHVGVFTPFIGPDSLNLFVLLPHKNLASLVSLSEKLKNDLVYQTDGADILNAPQNNPAFTRVNSTLLHAFPKFPKVKVSAATSQNGPRLFELRVYESHSEIALQTKIDQFCVGSTIDIFHKSGMTSVFYGETIVGQNQPSLHYMMVFENLEDLQAGWARFRAHPEWKKLSKNPHYSGTVSHSTKWFLNPASYSQI
jgi:hypothetical protein